MGLIVNGEPVDDALVQQEFEAVKRYESSRTHVSCCEKDAEFREKAVENVISRIVLLQEAERTTEAPTPETEPTEAELEAYYREHLDRYKTAEQVRFFHLVRSPARDERPAAYRELREVRERLLAGGDVEALWRDHSDSAKEPGAQGPDLGWVGFGEVLPELETVAFSLREGEVSPVFASMYGYHLVKVAERRPPVPRPLDEVRAEVREAFLHDRRRSRVTAFMDALRARAVVVKPPAAS